MPINHAEMYDSAEYSDVDIAFEVYAGDGEPANAPQEALEPPVKRPCTQSSSSGPRAPAQAAAASAQAPLKVIPGHKLVLAKSPYLKAQVRAWLIHFAHKPLKCCVRATSDPLM